MFQSDIKHSSIKLEDKLQKLYTLERGNRLELGFRPQYLALLEAFGNPHLSLPPTIHVAGTNGKGSTIAFLRAILEADGKRVHTYTSPHLIEFNERIVLAGQKISNNTLEALVDEALQLNNGAAVSFFEITTAIAFAAFSRSPADILLLETGLGGRLDCTNVIKAPLATIITPIGYDHQEYLGNTIEQIALEKAGIMKPGAPCIIAHQPYDDAQKALSRHAKNLKIHAYSAGADWRNEADPDPDSRHFRFLFGNNPYRCPIPALQGTHQIRNASTALAALHVIHDQLPVSHASIETGLQNAHWPARMQNLTRHANLPPDWELWLDGGHNKDAAHNLVTQFEQWQSTAPKPLHLITAMMDHKEKSGFMATITPHATAVHQTYIPGEQAANHPDWQSILGTLTQSETPARILICGSLYLAGNVLQRLGVQA